MKLTEPQRRGVETVGRSLLLSAAAGSGKTAVLARRCAHLVCGETTSDGVTIDPCGVENLLVVTFTNAAAQQMRDRIAARLAEELATAPEGSPRAARLRREIALLPRASISTLSSFCASLLRRHFHAAGVDPHFAVLDEDQARLLRRRVARQVFDEAYEQSQEAFLRLIDWYADGYDERMIEKVIACHHLLTSIVDPEEWRERARRQVVEAIDAGAFTKSDLGKALLTLVREETEHLLVEAQRLGEMAQSYGLDAYVKYVQEQLVNPAMEWLGFAETGDLDGLSQSVNGYDKGRLPTVRGAPEGKEQVQKAINDWKKQITLDKQRTNTHTLLRYSETEWREGLGRIAAPTAQFLDLVETFERRYAQAKSAIRSLDFADLERGALRLLLRDPKRLDPPQPSDIALHYQRQFVHVLVDEFQDINAVQATILSLLSRESAPADAPADFLPNLFAVGDVKQSIYRFRLAEPAMFMRRSHEAENGNGRLEQINLSHNFRSRGPLLEAINSAFHRLLSEEETLDIDYARGHRLTPNPDYPAVPPNGFSGTPVEIHVVDPKAAEAGEEESDEETDTGDPAAELERIEREAALVAQRIEQFKGEGRTVLGESGEPEPFDYKHVAVLLRSQKFNSERFAGVLRRMGVPCHSEVGTGFFASLEVRDVVSLLHVLDNRRQDIPLAAVLRSPLVDLPEAEDVLARVRLRYRQEIPFFEAVLRYAREQDDAIAARLRDVLDGLDKWRRLAHRRPLAELLWEVYTDSGYLAYVAGLHEGQQRVANLLELHKRAGQFDTFQRQGLGAFMEFLRSLEDAGEVGQPPVVSQADNVVRVMSIHASKGLEFPVVFLADCGKRHNLSDTRGSILLDREAGVALQAVDPVKQIRYPSAVHELARRRMTRASLAEELRVLYVAMTRAKEHLVCIGTAWKDAEAETAAWERYAEDERLASRDVLGGKSYLDWLGMASVGSAPGQFEVTVHGGAELGPIAKKLEARTRPGAVDEKLAGLEPLEGAVELSEAAQEALRRLTSAYEFAPVTELRAAAGVTGLVEGEKHGEAASLPKASFGRGEAQRVRGRLEAPACVEPGREPSAAEVGTATHDVLRLLNFREATDTSSITRQIDRMVERHQISATLARRVEVASILWLMDTPLGELLREHQPALLRELPVRVPADPAEVEPNWPLHLAGPPADPLDRVLLRGQVDVAVPLADGFTLADFKTDRLDPHDEAAISAKIAQYRPQLRLYAQAVAQVTNRPIRGAYLALLSARRLERLGPTELA